MKDLNSSTSSLAPESVLSPLPWSPPLTPLAAFSTPRKKLSISSPSTSLFIFFIDYQHRRREPWVATVVPKYGHSGKEVGRAGWCRWRDKGDMKLGKERLSNFMVYNKWSVYRCTTISHPSYERSVWRIFLAEVHLRHRLLTAP